MGQVYLAQDLTLGRRVALKFIKRSVMQGGGVERFLDEARATASFNHPHIVTLHAVGEHDVRPYLALEYIDGESLRARRSAGPLPMQDSLPTSASRSSSARRAPPRPARRRTWRPSAGAAPRPPARSTSGRSASWSTS